MSEWLPTSGYQYASAPDIEVYPQVIKKAPVITARFGFPSSRNSRFSHSITKSARLRRQMAPQAR